MNKTIKAILLTPILLTAANYANAQTEDEKKAIAQAKILYMQRKPAIPELRIAALTGDPESQFYLAEVLREKSHYITPEAKSWYEEAAKQGDYYSMFRLATASTDICQVLERCSDLHSAEWMKKLKTDAKAAAEGGDPQAMAIMYNATGDLKWLEKSAKADYPEAQYLLAHRYLEGHGFFWPGGRNKEANRLIQASAKYGYPPAMVAYSSICLERGEYESARKWLFDAAASGYASGVLNYALMLQDGLSKDEKTAKTEAYGLLTLILTLDGGGALNDIADYAMGILEKSMTTEDIVAAQQFARYWRDTYPPLSFYRTKLGY